MMALRIAWRELRTLFLSPLAWCVLAVVQVVMAWLFLGLVEQYLELAPRLVGNPAARGVTVEVCAKVFGTASTIMLLTVPLLSMRLLAEERRSGSLALLLSAPVSSTQIVLGKYLGLTGFLACNVLLLTLMPLSLGFGTSLDYGMLAADVLGLLLLTGAFAAAGLYISGLSRQPAVAAVGSFGLLLFLFVVNFLNRGDNRFTGILHYLSITDHYSALLGGSFDTADVAYYLLFIAGFLIFSVRRLAALLGLPVRADARDRVEAIGDRDDA